MPKLKYTEEFLSKYVEEITNGDYSLYDYDIKKKCGFKHMKCGNIFYMQHRKFVEGQRCKICNGGSYKGDAYYRIEVPKKFPHLEFIKNSKKKKMTLKCNIHDIEFDVLKNKTMEVYKEPCPECNTGRKHSQDYVSQEIHKVSNGEYVVTSQYINNHSDLYLKHIKCDNIVNIPYGKFMSENRRCRCDKMSSGERQISKYLIENNIKYLYDVSHPSSKNKQLRYDFILLEQNTVIEFDGEFHFKEIPDEWKTSHNNLKQIKDRDSRKDKFCENNDIQMIRIKYDQYNNIEKIINDQVLAKLDE